MTGIEDLKYLTDRVLNYARNISNHINELQTPCTEYEHAEHIDLIKYDIAELEKHTASLKASYCRMVNRSRTPTVKED